HEDLIGQIVQEYIIGSPWNESHGTSVASLIAGKTNNNKGIASIAHESKMIVSNNFNRNILDSIAAIPNVKVVNCSWVSCVYSETFELLIEDIVINRNVLVVAAAGNRSQGSNPNHGAWCFDSVGDKNGYVYPASYEYALSVTGVGNRYPIGNTQIEIDPESGNPYYHKSWRDVH